MDSRYLRRIAAVTPAMFVMAALMVGWTTPANAWGSTAGCGASQMRYQTNDWSYFWAHKIRVQEGVCVKMGKSATTNYPYLAWADTPNITFPSKFIISTESVELTSEPKVTKQYVNAYGKTTMLRYSFSAKSCSVKAICNDWDFYYFV